MHPTSVINENLFGDEYTAKFKEIVDTRLAIKHKDFDFARKAMGGALEKYLKDESVAKDLSNTLKTVINSVYGLTSARFKTHSEIRTLTILSLSVEPYLWLILNMLYRLEGLPSLILRLTGLRYQTQHPRSYNLLLITVRCMVTHLNTRLHTIVYVWLTTLFILLVTMSQVVVNGPRLVHSLQCLMYSKKLFSGEDIVFNDLCETKAVTTALYLDMNEKLPDVKDYEKERDKLWKKLLSTDPIANDIVDDMEKRLCELDALIAEGHNYIFVGKVGLFCPIKEGFGGGLLMRETTNAKTGTIGYAAATGYKGYRWLEAEMVQTLCKQDNIDRSFYDNLVNEAIDSMAVYGDVEWFMSEEKYAK